MEFTANWSTELLSTASGHGFPRSKPLLQLSATGPVSNEPIPTISTIPKLSATATIQHGTADNPIPSKLSGPANGCSAAPAE